jgi:hypothetical protein
MKKVATILILSLPFFAFGQHQFGLDIGPRIQKYRAARTIDGIGMKQHLSATVGVAFRFDLNDQFYIEGGIRSYNNHASFTIERDGHPYFSNLAFSVERGVKIPITLLYKMPINKTYFTQFGAGLGTSLNRKTTLSEQIAFQDAKEGSTGAYQIDVISTESRGGGSFLTLVGEFQALISETLLANVQVSGIVPFAPTDLTAMDLRYFDNGANQSIERFSIERGGPTFQLMLGFRYRIIPDSVDPQ